MPWDCFWTCSVQHMHNVHTTSLRPVMLQLLVHSLDGQRYHILIIHTRSVDALLESHICC